MNKLDKKLEEIKQKNRMGLMTHVVVGYPGLDETVTIVKTMARLGADIVELQIPFSDPLADGPSIMRACEKSLENGTKVKDAFTVMKQLSSEVEIPLLFMAYYNTVFAYGVEKFCSEASKAGAAGLIVPDMPIEEEGEEHFFECEKEHGLHTIQVLSPASTEERMKKNAKVATGFIYCTTRQGVTGATDTLDPAIVTYLKKVKKYFSIPIAAGFGISKKEHLEILKPYADIAIIGSAIIDVINKSAPNELESNIESFFGKLFLE